MSTPTYRILTVLYHRPAGLLPWELCQAAGVDRTLLALIESDLLNRGLVREDRTGIKITMAGDDFYRRLDAREEARKERLGR